MQLITALKRIEQFLFNPFFGIWSSRKKDCLEKVNKDKPTSIIVYNFFLYILSETIILT